MDKWNWKPEVKDESLDTFHERKNAATHYGDNMKFIIDTLQDDLFGVYEDTELLPLVDELLNDDSLRHSELTAEERQQLADSDLADYIELKLS